MHILLQQCAKDGGADIMSVAELAQKLFCPRWRAFDISSTEIEKDIGGVTSLDASVHFNEGKAN